MLHNFSAAMIARGAQSPFCFMRTTDVHRGTVEISVESLSRIFERKIQESESKVSNIKLKLGMGEVHLSGKLHKGITIPFSIDGDLTTDGTMLILNEKKFHAEGVPVKGLLALVGIHLSSLISSESIEGVSAQGNTLIFAPEKIAHVKGHIQSLDVNPNRLEIVFAGTETREKTGTASREAASGK